METPLPYPAFGTGSCMNCGFLTYRRAATNSADFDEVTAEMRYNAYFPQGEVHCFVNARPFVEDICELGGIPNTLNPEQIKTLIEKDRKCDSWCKWQEGIDPKEHFEQVRAQQLEQDRRAFELKLFEMSQKVQEDSRAIAKSATSFNWRITWLILALAFLEVVGTFLALAYPNGADWLERLVP